MDQGAFPSEYGREYRWFEDAYRTPVGADQTDIYADPKRDEKFLVTYGDQELPATEAEAIIRALYRDRMQTVYQVDYRDPRSRSRKQEEDSSEQDELLDSMNRIFTPYNEKLLPPVASSRKVLGYCPMRRYLTGRTTYIDHYLKPAFDILKRDADRGVHRLAPRQRAKPQTDYSVPACRLGKEIPEPTWIHLTPTPV